MWECRCGAHNSDGVDPCMCGQPKSPEKARSTVKPKLAANETRKLVKPRPKATGGSRRYCVRCGVRVYTDDCIRQNNDDYYHHACLPEALDD